MVDYDYIMHYGVVGMKWGRHTARAVRQYNRALNRKSKADDRLYNAGQSVHQNLMTADKGYRDAVTSGRIVPKAHGDGYKVKMELDAKKGAPFSKRRKDYKDAKEQLAKYESALSSDKEYKKSLKRSLMVEKRLEKLIKKQTERFKDTKIEDLDSDVLSLGRKGAAWYSKIHGGSVAKNLADFQVEIDRRSIVDDED